MAASAVTTLRLSLPLPLSKTNSAVATNLVFPVYSSFGRRDTNGLRAATIAHAAISRSSESAFDPELRSVLELATDSELYELERILYGRSYFSPLLKSIASGVNVDHVMIEEDLDERETYIAALESRFFFLAADARSTLRGWRPSYRDVLLAVRKELNVPCSSKLSTEDLEAEVFLHLVHEYSRYNHMLICTHKMHLSFQVMVQLDVVIMLGLLLKSSSEESGSFPSLWKSSEESGGQGGLELGLNQWKVQAASPLKAGAAELRSLILKGGSMFTLAKIYQLLARRLSAKVFLEAANYLIKKDVIRKGGQLAAINLESRAALLAAKQGFAGAASRYLGFRSMMTIFGPVLWGTLLADVVIQMLGTDYARILRAIYAFAQIRVTRTYRLPSDND
ncbi:hypothetical protein HS088_TW16G00505 [Tripterygium wilfordii]|uniref:Uncharacterized protein n=1 Tax=Tripterygium wilfordii TaxID=458696 RepID=A0A7J7CJ16_TRIWF|nr:uncharacterized protein LOC119981515 isoform X1 [Tripterygium wilfordii]KAF5734063.1 hypothetical protein HS088_TW16G00505 [Tripterygium wilfordii]